MAKFHFFSKKVKFSLKTKKSEIHKKNSEKKHYVQKDKMEAAKTRRKWDSLF